ncbi:uncharacterized protein METZ01_LOCUS133742, partial [marine metagenome]
NIEPIVMTHDASSFMPAFSVLVAIRRPKVSQLPGADGVDCLHAVRCRV